MKNIVGIGFLLVLTACNQPVELKNDKETANPPTKVFGGEEPFRTQEPGVIRSKHRVKVVEHISGKRYSYLSVAEQDDVYWIATMGSEFEVGAWYDYQEGLEKTDYTSTELGRTFDRILLVSALMPVVEAAAVTGDRPAHSLPEGPIEVPKSSVLIKNLVNNRLKYSNKTVEVTGRITKVNPGIMDRNWIHLVDGSLDSYDFVCTTVEELPVGHVVTLQGKVTADKDFGAGYFYELILENAVLVK